MALFTLVVVLLTVMLIPMALFTLVVVADPNGFVYIGCCFVDSNADPNGRGTSREWVEKLVIVGYPKAATSVHITGNT